MHSLISRWRILALLLPIAAVVAAVVVFGSSLFTGSDAEAADAVEPGVTCSDLYVDFPPFSKWGTAQGGPDPRAAKSINRLEPLQPNVPGQWQIMSATYIGPANPGIPLPYKPPSDACQPKIAAAAGALEANQLNDDLSFGNQYNDDRGTIGTEAASAFDYSKEEDGAPNVGLSSTCLDGIDNGGGDGADFLDPDCYQAGSALTYTTCTESAALNSWVRIDVNANVKDAGAGKSYGQVILFTDAGSPLDPEDPTTCSIEGAVLYETAFPNVLVSTARDATTDDTARTKEAALGIPADPSGAAPNDTADGLADDWDGDGCPDWDELDKSFWHGSDPFNPNDCDQNYDSILSALATVLGAGNSGGQIKGTPGIYFHCRADSQHDKGLNEIDVLLQCYTDNPAVAVNANIGTTCPAFCGDGYPGTPPPGGDDNLPYGDVNPIRPLLIGSVIKTETCLTKPANLAPNGPPTVTFVDGGPCVAISGCFPGIPGVLGPNVYVDATVHIQNGAGYVDIWVARPNCDVPVVAPTFANAYLQLVEQQSKNTAKPPRDSDDDGCSDKDEVQHMGTGAPEGPTGPGKQGDARDPYNEWDFYDVNGDKIVTLQTDIVPVIGRFQTPTVNPNPSTGLSYAIQYDRGSTMAGGAGSWNKRAADNVITLQDDILGVILQFGHTCA